MTFSPIFFGLISSTENEKCKGAILFSKIPFCCSALIPAFNYFYLFPRNRRQKCTVHTYLTSWQEGRNIKSLFTLTQFMRGWVEISIPLNFVPLRSTTTLVSLGKPFMSITVDLKGGTLLLTAFIICVYHSAIPSLRSVQSKCEIEAYI